MYEMLRKTDRNLVLDMQRNRPAHGVLIVGKNVYGSSELTLRKLQDINAVNARKHSPYEARRSESIPMFLRKMWFFIIK